MALRRRLPPALRHRDYALYWASIVPTAFSEQMVVVAVGWQVYAIHRSAFDLGLIGLMAFVPMPLLALPAGHLADRVPRSRVLALSYLVQLSVAALLLVVTVEGARALWPFLLLALATGAGIALGAPAGRALSPSLVPLELVQSAVTLRSIAFQASIVGGPALGGALFALSPRVVYVTAAALALVGVGCIAAVRDPVRERGEGGATLDTLLAGVRFIRSTPIILGSISLDLFAVLFGGAEALLPLFARSILHTGPIGLGVLRSAPAAGALLAGIVLARRPLANRVGRTLLVAVAAFGASMVVFGLSRSLPLSCVALAVSGFADMFSMNIRSTTVALATPDELRGRVLAVEWVFISASNELGAFESGAAAALLGAVTSVVAGGAITIGLAAAWTRLFPALATVDRFDDAAPGSLRADAAGAHSTGSPA